MKNIVFKGILLIFILIMPIQGVNALHEVDNGTITLYNNTDLRYKSFSSNPIKDVICENSACIECMIDVGERDPYEIDYIFRYAHNTSDYKESIYTLKQEMITSYWGLKKVYRRTLLINGLLMSSYNCSNIIGIGKRNVFKFNSIDHTVTYGNKEIKGQTIAFTQLNCQDQYNLTLSGTPVIIMKFKTVEGNYDDDGNFVLDEASRELKLQGLTGIFLNAVTKIPLIGKGLYNIMYIPLVLIQYTFNFSFAFIDIILNDWWYALMVLEIICIIPALKRKSFPVVIKIYIDNHVKVVMFVYLKVILPLIAQILRLVEIIRNLFRI